MIIRIPGSSANIGPGFDCFGIGWQVYNNIEFLPADMLKISGCPEEFQNEENLAWLGYKAVMEAAGIENTAVEIKFLESDIPVSRGLGSSAALIVGGAVAANEMHGLKLSRQQILELTAHIEGHPDNIAPSVFGGFSVSVMDGERVVSAQFPLSEKLSFTALIPDFKLSTELARSVLPQSYSRADAIFNISRASLMIKALEAGDGELVKAALHDRIHQPYRTGLIKGYDKAEELALFLGACGVCVSGAGPTILCVSEKESFSAKMRKAMAEEFPTWQVMELLVDREGAVKL